MTGLGEDDSLEIELVKMEGMDWDNDSLFFTHEWRDETSQFDRHHSVRWEGGSECYTRDFKARVPLAFRDSDEMIDRFLTLMMEDFPDTEGFWRD